MIRGTEWARLQKRHYRHSQRYIYIHWQNPQKTIPRHNSIPCKLDTLENRRQVWQKLKVCCIGREMVLLFQKPHRSSSKLHWWLNIWSSNFTSVYITYNHWKQGLKKIPALQCSQSISCNRQRYNQPKCSFTDDSIKRCTHRLCNFDLFYCEVD